MKPLFERAGAIYPIRAFEKVCPTRALRAILIRHYAKLGWERFVTWTESRGMTIVGFGVSAAASHYPDNIIPEYPPINPEV